VEVVPLEAPDKDLHQTRLPHFFLYGRTRADVEEDVETDKEQLVLLPDEHIEDLQFLLGVYPILLIVLPPHLDVLTIEQVKSLNLVLQDIDDGQTHLVLSEQLLKLLIVAENIKNAEDVHRQIYVALVVLGESTAKHRKQ